MAKPKRKQQIELTIENVAYGGKGIARMDDFVVFVERSLPGDVVLARITKVRKQYAEAYPVELLKPSAFRQEAPCRHFGYCGGCKWQNVAYAQQLQFKQQHVEESLRHIGDIQPEAMHPVLPSPRIFGYRNKMEFSFAGKGWLTPAELEDDSIKKEFALGLHVPGHFDRIINIEECLLQSENMNIVLNFSRDYLRQTGIPVYHVRNHEGVLRFLVLRESFATGNIMINLVTAEPVEKELKEYVALINQKFPFVSSIVNSINTRRAQVATGERFIPLYGEPVLYEKIGQYRFEISPESFFQTNPIQTENLYNVIKSYAGIQNDVVWDLYSGTGSIAIFIAGDARKVVGFEVVESSVQDAYRNARLNKIDNCEFIAGDVRVNLEKFSSSPPDVLICDPPRAGLHKDVLEVILTITPPKIIYVSCNPTTLARDLAVLGNHYRVAEVQPVDMFPHTHHIETVVRLVRK